jgi:hypothetical protein
MHRQHLQMSAIKKCMEHWEMALQEKASRGDSETRRRMNDQKLQSSQLRLAKVDCNIRRTAKEVEHALKGLEEESPERRRDAKVEGRRAKARSPKSMLQDCITHCKSNIESAKVHLEEERRKEQEAMEMREVQRSAAEAQKQEELRKPEWNKSAKSKSKRSVIERQLRK